MKAKNIGGDIYKLIPVNYDMTTNMEHFKSDFNHLWGHYSFLFNEEKDVKEALDAIFDIIGMDNS